MMQRETNLSKTQFKGSRCRICTGCGRCVNGSGIHIVTSREKGLDDEKKPIYSPRGERLVTADIGTTTIALQLYDESGTVAADYAVVNPQTAFGADVLSRIAAAQETAARERMRWSVVDQIRKALEGFEAFLRPKERMRMVLAGNTTMVYLLMGYDPSELGRAPFLARHLEIVETDIETAHQRVPCTVFPGLSAFVGGDIAAGMYACGMTEKEEITLLVDLGTNGEMVLGNRHRRIACATAAGPAFEGGVNRGVWGADMVHLLACLKREGIVDETGLLAEPYFEEGILIGDVRVSQEAIRAIQLAKAAVGAGIRILMKEYGIGGCGEIDRVILAGGFGYHLDPSDAEEIGLLPPDLAGKARAGGNTALAGALRLGRELLAKDGEETPAVEARLGIRGTEMINLAAHPDFEKLYVQHMNLVS